MAQGWHFTFQAKGIDRELLMNPEIIEQSMCALIPSLGLEMVGMPRVFMGKGHGEWGPGVSVLIGLSDSHLALHCLADEGIVFFDLFSCKVFDHRDLLNSLVLIFDPKWHQSNIMSRVIEDNDG